MQVRVEPTTEAKELRQVLDAISLHAHRAMWWDEGGEADENTYQALNAEVLDKIRCLLWESGFHR